MPTILQRTYLRRFILAFWLSLIAFLSQSRFISAQTPHLDSLKNALRSNIHDTIRCKLLSELAETADEAEWPAFNAQLKKICEQKLSLKDLDKKETRAYTSYLAMAINNEGYIAQSTSDFKRSLVLFKESVRLAESVDDTISLPNLLLNVSYSQQWLGNVNEALDYALRALNILKRRGDEKALIMALNNTASVYSDQGNITKAIEMHYQSLKLSEKLNDKQGIALALNHLGSIYHHQGETKTAFDYFQRCLKIREELNDQRGIGNVLINIALLYNDEGNWAKSKELTERSLKIRKAINDRAGIANSLNNLANIADVKKDFNNSLKYNLQSLAIRTEIGDLEGTAYSYYNLARCYLNLNRIKDAEAVAMQLMELGLKLKNLELQRNASNLLHTIKERQGQFQEALKYANDFIRLNASILDTANKKALIRTQLQYEFNKKVLADSLSKAKELEIRNARFAKQEAELKAKRNLQIALIGGLLLTLAFTLLIYRRYRISQEQRKIIEAQHAETDQQKKLIELKNRDILDSIGYAKRLQEAILPSEKQLHDILPESFVFYQPKDLVAGDFYWIDETAEHIFLAVADCTGHGVPGALVSVVCHNALNRAVKEFSLSDPGQILDKVRTLVIETFSRSTGNVNDGMDISLCVFDRSLKRLRWAGANNGLYIRRSNVALLEELKGDKQPVGAYDLYKPFTTHNISLNKNDTLFLMTDGLADQFGGPEGKKFMVKRIKHVFIQSTEDSLSRFKFQLIETFQKWKGREEQIDDICVLGVRI